MLLLGVADIAASRRFYVDRGLTVDKDAGVAPDGSGSHRVVLGSRAGAFTDPDGFTWEAA